MKSVIVIIFVAIYTVCLIEMNELLHCCEVWNVDQGAGWGGVLTIMDVDTKEFWTSDKVERLYPEIYAGMNIQTLITMLSKDKSW